MTVSCCIQLIEIDHEANFYEKLNNFHKFLQSESSLFHKRDDRTAVVLFNDSLLIQGSQIHHFVEMIQYMRESLLDDGILMKGLITEEPIFPRFDRKTIQETIDMIWKGVKDPFISPNVRGMHLTEYGMELCFRIRKMVSYVITPDHNTSNTFLLKHTVPVLCPGAGRKGLHAVRDLKVRNNMIPEIRFTHFIKTFFRCVHLCPRHAANAVPFMENVILSLGSDRGRRYSDIRCGEQLLNYFFDGNLYEAVFTLKETRLLFLTILIRCFDIENTTYQPIQDERIRYYMFSMLKDHPEFLSDLESVPGIILSPLDRKRIHLAFRDM